MSRESVVNWADGTTSKVTFSVYGSSLDTVPLTPAMQRITAEVKAQREAEMNTPENSQKAIEAEMAERERKKIDFHFKRALPRFVEEGWKQIREEFADEEIRVYTIDNQQRKFWGIKPTGMEMDDFWEQNDPEVRRYHDLIAMTWADPLIPPAFNTWEGDRPVFWAGQGVNPDSNPPEPPTAPAPAPVPSIFARSKRRQKTPEVNPSHRVGKSTAPSPKIRRKKARMSSEDAIDAGHSQLENPTLVEEKVAPASDGPSRSSGTVATSDAQQEPAAKDEDSAPSKRPRGRPAARNNPAPKDDTSSLPKRHRGRPAKAKPAAISGDTSLPKRPRGRPPGKGKPPAVKGNARITKPSQTKQRPSAPSNHKMRTRGKGTAQLLQLP